MFIEIALISLSVFIIIQFLVGFWIFKKFSSRKNDSLLSPNTSENNQQDVEWRKRWQEEEKITRQRILELQENIDRKETALDEKLNKLEKDKELVEETKNNLREIKSDLLARIDELKIKESQLIENYESKLSGLAKITSSEAKSIILNTAKKDVGNDLLEWQQKFIENKREEANLEAREIVALAVQ